MTKETSKTTTWARPKGRVNIEEMMKNNNSLHMLPDAIHMLPDEARVNLEEMSCNDIDF